MNLLSCMLKKKVQASVSVLLIIIMLPTMIFAGVIVDSSRKNMAQSMISGAGDLAINAALANYDTILKDVYGLFAMSQQEGDTAEELSSRIMKYFQDTLVSYGVVQEEAAPDYVAALLGDFNKYLSMTEDEEASASDFLSMTVNEDSFSVKGVSDSALNQPEVLRNQIVEYMKYRAPINFSLSFLDGITAFKRIEKQTEVVEKQVKVQEETQSVTDACKKLISLIRAYDDLVRELEGDADCGHKTKHEPFEFGSGLEALEWKTSVLLKISDAARQDNTPGGYGGILRSFGKSSMFTPLSYETISKLYMTYLLCSPDSAAYWLMANEDGLSKLKYKEYVTKTADGTHFTIDTALAQEVIRKADAAGISRMDISAVTDTKQALLDKIGDIGVARSVIQSYEATDYLPDIKQYAYATADDALKKFTDDLINNHVGLLAKKTMDEEFAEYERFLLEGNSYKDIQRALVSLADLSILYEKFENEIDQEIQSLEQVRDEWQTALQNIRSSCDSISAQLKINANNGKSNLADNLPDSVKTALSRAKTGKNQTVWSELSTVLSESEKTKLDGVKEICRVKTIPPQVIAEKDIMAYLAVPGEQQDKYFGLIEEICTALAGNDDVKRIVSSAKSYRNLQNPEKSFSDFLAESCPKEEKEQWKAHALTKLFEALFNSHRAVESIKGDLKTYNASVQNYAENSKKVEDKKTEKETVKRQYSDSVSGCQSGTNQYAEDLMAYEIWKRFVSATIGTMVGVLQSYVNRISVNLSALVTAMENIDIQCGNVKTAIEDYNKLVDEWETEKGNYEKTHGADSFSKQNKADIDAAREAYDAEQLLTLQNYAKNLQKQFSAVKAFADGENGTGLRYGSKPLIEIINTASLGLAVKDSGAALPQGIVTSAGAAAPFESLCAFARTGTEFPKITEEYIKFLDPVLQIPFLSYLNSNYPEEQAALTEAEQKDQDEKVSQWDDVNTNTVNKSESAEDAGSSSAGSGNTGYGYTYESGRTMTDCSPKSVSSNAFNSSSKTTKEEDGSSKKTVNASDSFTEQKNSMNSVLGGLADVAVNQVENAYILSYIFENFSYNTVVQDAVADMKEKELKGKNPWTQLSNMNSYLSSDSEDLAFIRNPDNKAIRTLSNYPISPGNNYAFGAEIEYILFGNADLKKNISSMKTSIYAIRFAFDCLFAFTNSEIRNLTRGVGLAVQAATLGIVPYQIVQVVLQLALAAGEAAMDLQLIGLGVDIAIIKSEQTWMLSLKGAINGVVDYALQEATDFASQKIDELYGYAKGAVLNLANSTVDNLASNVTDLLDDVEGMTKNSINSYADGIFGSISSEIEKELNKLQSLDYAGIGSMEPLAYAESKVNEVFDSVKRSVENPGGSIRKQFGQSELGKKVLDKIAAVASTKLDALKSSCISMLREKVPAGSTASVVSTGLNSCITGMKQKAVNIMTSWVDSFGEKIDELVIGATEGVKSEIGSLVNSFDDEVGEAKDKALEKFKSAIQDKTKDFLGSIDTDLSFADGAGGDMGDSVASMIVFGYEEYLMLFLFIKMNTDPDSVMKRLANCIQANIRWASESSTAEEQLLRSSYTHASGNTFAMNKAYTYVTINADVQLDSLFLKWNPFREALYESEEGDPEAAESEETAADETETQTAAAEEEVLKGFSLHYNGFMGY